MKKSIKHIKNEKIIVYSNLSLLLITNKSKTIINNALKIIKILIKNKNTIIIPTFNFNFAKTKKTSYNPDLITTGYLNKFLLKKYNFKRTNKPIYNYGVLGPKALDILNLEQKTAFGIDSVIGYLSLNKSICLGIGVEPNNFNWVTIHVCEELGKVPYRFFKKFVGLNLNTRKKVSEIIYVRKKSFDVVNTGKKINEILIKKKKISKTKFKNLNLVSLRLNDYFKEGMKLLEKNKFALTR